MHFLHLIAVSCVGALTPLATPRIIRATRLQAAAVEAKADWNGAYPSGAAEEFDEALQCLSLDSDDESCSIAYLEDVFRKVDTEKVQGRRPLPRHRRDEKPSLSQVRSECDADQEAKIDELWKIIKMMYGGASRKEAIVARRKLPVPDTGVADAYSLCLRFLNPATSKAAGCSKEALDRALELLDCEGDECLALNEGQLQVLDQLHKCVDRIDAGESVEAAVQNTWDAREAVARKRLADYYTS